MPFSPSLVRGFLRGLVGERGKTTQPARPLPPERMVVVAGLHDSPYGVNSHTAAPDMIATLAAAGINWHRLDVDWDAIEAQEGMLDWAALDATVEAARQRGLVLLGSIAYTPAWASGADPALGREARQGLMPRDPQRYLRFVDAVIDRYGTRFSALAIWNEPNQEKYFRGTRDEYLHEILRPGLERLRDRAPQVARCGPDLSSSPPKKPHEWLKDVLRVAGDLIDIITHHQYDGRNTPRGRATEVEKVRKLILQEGYGDRHLWITETGWKRGEVTAEAQAAHLAGMFEVMAARREWWKKTFWFDSHGPGEGLLGPDGAPDRGQPFAAFNRYAAVVQETHQA